jgi:hypothetical protein
VFIDDQLEIDNDGIHSARARRAIELDMLHEVPQAQFVLGISFGQKGDVAGALQVRLDWK